MIIIPPEKILADPRLAMACPIMKAVELGAAPQSADPASRSQSKAENPILSSNLHDLLVILF
jgi:hypothetical protein